MTILSLTCPTSLEITPGAHPTAVSRSISGATRTRLLGPVPVGATIRAEFSGTSAEAAQAMADYHATYSGAQPIDLPPELFAGHEAVLEALPALPWFFADEPNITPVFGDRCSIRLEFSQRLEV